MVQIYDTLATALNGVYLDDHTKGDVTFHTCPTNVLKAMGIMQLSKPSLGPIGSRQRFPQIIKMCVAYIRRDLATRHLPGHPVVEKAAATLKRENGASCHTSMRVFGYERLTASQENEPVDQPSC